MSKVLHLCAKRSHLFIKKGFSLKSEKTSKAHGFFKKNISFFKKKNCLALKLHKQRTKGWRHNVELKRFHWNHLNYCKDTQRVIAKAESEALGKRLRAETQHTQTQRWLNKHKLQNKVNDLVRRAHALEGKTLPAVELLALWKAISC